MNGMKKQKVLSRSILSALICFVLIAMIDNGRPLLAAQEAATQAADTFFHRVEAGDTWTALTWRYGLGPEQVAALLPGLNRQRQPVIGSVLTIPETGIRRNGQIWREEGGLLATAVAQNRSPWEIALQNGMAHPYRPLMHRPLFLPGGEEPPREWPVGMRHLTLSQTPAAPGQAVAFQAEVEERMGETAVFSATLGTNAIPTFRQNDKIVGLTGTNAFFGRGAPELAITAPGGGPLWAQPWQFEDREWAYQDLTLTGGAAQITREEIEAERARLFGIWRQVNGGMQWERPFQLPVQNFLTLSADYGVRRSYNGGPYRSYHEGVDFSAYGGTPVLAPAAGAVVLAENLAVRGGAVIIDHGLGVYTGYYHLSAIHVSAGDPVTPGQIVGEVGTTGLSTGNHLHWDMLVDGIWVDAAAWREQGMGCWVRLGLDLPCS